MIALHVPILGGSLEPMSGATLALLTLLQAVESPGELPTVRLPDFARPLRYELDLTVDPTKATFSGEVRIHLQVTRATARLWLNATDLQVAVARVETGSTTRPARPGPAGDGFVAFDFEAPLTPGPAVLVVRYEGSIDEVRSRGLYRVRESDGLWYAYTFFEPIDARRVVPCFDEPSAKVSWRLTLHVRRGDVALANAPVESERDEADGRKVVTFAESKPLPSYLLAFVVGPFDVVPSGTAGSHGTPLRFVVPRGRADELRYAREVTTWSVGLLEDYFGMPYPFLKLDVAVVPRYWGTMEHPGLVAMGQPLALIRPGEESAGRREWYAAILTHELAHYWFGDYVTCAWWDDTWLNESLGSWIDGKLIDRLEPSWRRVTTKQRYTGLALDADALATAKRIRQPVLSRSDIESSFDNNITYFKGAAVVGMFERWLGEDPFRAAVRRYMAAHAWGNATALDFTHALDAATGRDVTGPFRTFVDQPGFPLVSASLDCTGSPRLRLRQERFLAVGGGAADRSTWRVPVCVRWAAKGAASRSCTLMESREQDIPLGDACPDWAALKEGGLGYYRVAYDDDLRRRVSSEVAKGTAAALSPEERIAFLDDLPALVKVGKLEARDALGGLPAFLADPDPLVAYEALDVLDLVKAEHLPVALRGPYTHLVRSTLGKRAAALGWQVREADPPDVRLLRRRLVAVAAIDGDDAALRAEARTRTLAWLADRKSADPDLALPLLTAAAFRGDRSLFDRVLAEARGTHDREEQPKLLESLGSFRDPALAGEALGLVLGKDFDIRDAVGILRALVRFPETRELAWGFAKAHFDEIVARMRMDESARLVFQLASVFCDDAHRREAGAFFEPRAGRIDGAPLALANALERIDACVAEQERMAPGIAAVLGAY